MSAVPHSPRSARGLAATGELLPRVMRLTLRMDRPDDPRTRHGPSGSATESPRRCPSATTLPADEWRTVGRLDPLLRVVLIRRPVFDERGIYWHFVSPVSVMSDDPVTKCDRRSTGVGGMQAAPPSVAIRVEALRADSSVLLHCHRRLVGLYQAVGRQWFQGTQDSRLPPARPSLIGAVHGGAEERGPASLSRPQPGRPGAGASWRRAPRDRAGRAGRSGPGHLPPQGARSRRARPRPRGLPALCLTSHGREARALGPAAGGFLPGGLLSPTAPGRPPWLGPRHGALGRCRASGGAGSRGRRRSRTP